LYMAHQLFDLSSLGRTPPKLKMRFAPFKNTSPRQTGDELLRLAVPSQFLFLEKPGRFRPNRKPRP